MKRRRMLAGPALPSTTSERAALAVGQGDLARLAAVVTARLSVRAARLHLQRTVGNPVSYRLVELGRGERPGVVRAVEIHHAASGQTSVVRAERELANGQPASFFVPDALVRMRPVVEGPAGRVGALEAEDRLVLVVPVRGYLRFLPALFSGEGPVAIRQAETVTSTQLARVGGAEIERRWEDRDVDAHPLRRFLFLLQHQHTTVTDTLDGLADLTDPLACAPKFLPWLASWVGFDLDASLPIHQQRELVRRAIRLYRTRGTRVGVEEMVEVLTTAPVRARERQRPAPMALGRAHLVGGEDVVGRYHRREAQGCYLVAPEAHADTDFFVLLLEPADAFRARFGERAEHVLRRIADVVSHERPAHVAFTLRFDESV